MGKIFPRLCIEDQAAIVIPDGRGEARSTGAGDGGSSTGRCASSNQEKALNSILAGSGLCTGSSVILVTDKIDEG